MNVVCVQFRSRKSMVKQRKAKKNTMHTGVIVSNVYDYEIKACTFASFHKQHCAMCTVDALSLIYYRDCAFEIMFFFVCGLFWSKFHVTYPLWFAHQVFNNCRRQFLHFSLLTLVHFWCFAHRIRLKVFACCTKANRCAVLRPKNAQLSQKSKFVQTKINMICCWKFWVRVLFRDWWSLSKDKYLPVGGVSINQVRKSANLSSWDRNKLLPTSKKRKHIQKQQHFNCRASSSS